MWVHFVLGGLDHGRDGLGRVDGVQVRALFRRQDGTSGRDVLLHLALFFLLRAQSHGIFNLRGAKRNGDDV